MVLIPDTTTVNKLIKVAMTYRQWQLFLCLATDLSVLQKGTPGRCLDCGARRAIFS